MQNEGKVPREGQAAPWGTVSRLAAGIPVLLMRGSPNEEVAESAAPSEGALPDPVADPTTLSVKELRDALRARGVDYSGCIEKSELVALLQSVAH